jgi:hypothetical protein
MMKFSAKEIEPALDHSAGFDMLLIGETAGASPG